MERKSTFAGAIVMAVGAALVLAACAATSSQTVSDKHPAVNKDPLCGECHEDKKAMDHNKDWGTKHEFTRGALKPDCILCHGDIAACGGMCHPS